MSIARQKKIGFFLQALVFAWFLGPAIPALAQEVVADPPSRVARLGFIEGEVTMAPAGTEEWAEAILNRPVTNGDRLWTESGARAELQIGSASAYLDGQTGFGFVELDDNVMQMSLTQGAATIRVRRLAEDETIQVETPNVAIALKEPGEYHIEVDPETDRTIVKTRHGLADVYAGDENHIVRADEQGVFSGLEQLTADLQPLEPRSDFENWANDRERREQESRSAQYVSRDVVGYEDLDEHGDWHHEAEYGYVWRPRYVTSHWAPYRDGRWVWVSPWGWTWVDHSRWGFAPFHYGRWAHVRNRWCWVPGPRHYRPVYAPALVGWVGGPHVSVSVSFGHGIGWFPLGPREVYFPGYRHSPRYIRHVNVSNTIIVNNTYINNVYAGRHRNFDYRYGRHPHAVTAIDRGQFIGGRPVMGRILRVDERELRQWRHEARPPALTPDRASVLAGSVRRAPPIIRGDREGRSARIATNRIGFDAERRHIEANGGRPIGRTNLYRGDPKDGNDFRRGGARSEVIRAGTRQAEHRNDAVARGSTREQRLLTSPALESTRRPERNQSSSFSSERRTRSETRAADVTGRAFRGSDAVRSSDSIRSTSPSDRFHQDGARNAPSRSSQWRAPPREQSLQPRVQSSPSPAQRIEQPAAAQRAWRSAERAQPAPQRAESRSAPEPQRRSQSNVESRQQRAPAADRGSSGGRSHGESRGNSRFQQR